MIKYITTTSLTNILNLRSAKKMDTTTSSKPAKPNTGRRHKPRNRTRKARPKESTSQDSDVRKSVVTTSDKNVKTNESKKRDTKHSGNDKISDIRRKGAAFSKNSKTLRMSKQLKAEVQQVQHILGADNFKIFKKGKNSTSYGLVAPHVLDQDQFVFTVIVPFSYPQQSSKLDPLDNTLHDESASNDLSVKLGTIINNFNSKAHEMTTSGQPLITQINYLLTQWSKLSNPNYKQKDRLYKEFLATYT
ncbi:LANO_0H24982g1_1 [Lachancea nothofagi CBS 11611]|uniref:LANO_0H24982g1_1 n=1 Tax=Lachancea nothofagi CBS 11611 TaxID=1266666 RepID=A0A1G4KNZ9_9SACH|nr:LANO_0H24982g1_1 [Lachancea nothofagi CBS 11611]